MLNARKEDTAKIRFSGISSIFLILGGGLIISTLIYILNNLADRAIYYVGIPGVVAGLIILWIGFNVSKRENRG
jgi:precorrin-2 methylase